MGKKILEITREDEDNVKKWVASEYKYLKEFEQDLGELKKHMNDLKTEKKILGKSKEALTMVGRAESRVSRFYKGLDKDVEKLDKMLPDKLRQEGLNVKKQIKIAAESILKMSSRYVGSLKNQLKALIIQFELLKKYKNKPQEEATLHNINFVINNLIKVIEDMLKWVRGLVGAVKIEESFEAQLRRAT